MEASMKDSGRMIFSTVKENGHILMVPLLILISVSEENTGRHNTLSQQAMLMIAFTIMTWRIDLITVALDAGTVLG